jgi:thioesterase domain-containing protein/acyl carrier protein
MQPAFLVRLGTLPLMPNGKTDRNALRLPDNLPAGDAGVRREPSESREIIMAEIWEDVLGRRPIGLDDDFFELGGHSLLGARLLTRVEKAFGAKLPMESLFLAPTVARMMELVSRQSRGDPVPPVIPLRIGTRRAPLILTDIQPLYRSLSLRLPAERSIYGMAFLDPAGLPVPCDLAQIATRQVEALLRSHTGGRLVLAGWCAGGVLACEMAQQLAARGTVVPLLVLFDSYNGAAQNGHWLSRERLRHHLATASRLPAGSLMAYWRGRLRNVARRIRTKAWRTGYRMGLMTGQGIAGSLHDPDQLLALSASKYSPRPYSGAVLLFRPQSRPAGDRADAASRWRQLAPGLRVVDVPGNHVEMFREPHVAVMAEALEAALEGIEVERVAEVFGGG